MILATWYKRKVKASLMGQMYIDQKKILGIDIADKDENEKIWGRYVEAFKKGAYNFIKEEYDPVTRETIPRKYFSGGFKLGIEVLTEVPSPENVTFKSPKLMRTDGRAENAQSLSKDASEKTEVVYAGDGDLKYVEQGIRVKEMKVDHPPYVARFLRHINPNHSLLQRSGYLSAIAQDEAKGTRISLVHEIPHQVLEHSDRYKDLVTAIKDTAAFKNNKISFQDEEAMHFTLVGGLESSGKSIEDLKKEFVIALGENEPLHIKVKGPWANKYIYGRVFLRVYPEINVNTRENKVGQAIVSAGGKDNGVYPIPFFQLKDDLATAEELEIQRVFDDFQNQEILEYDIDQLSVVSFSNDLIANKKSISVNLGENNKAENINTNVSSGLASRSNIVRDYSEGLQGGINLNPQAMGMDIAKDGNGVELAFDPAMAAQFKQGDFAGVVPVILSITSVKDPLAALGLSPSTP